MPLPPYIHENWMTVNVIKRSKESGSAAAPTAGLHFHQRTASRNPSQGVFIWSISLFTSDPEPLGTCSVDNLDEHEMHLNSYQLSEEAAATLRSVKENGGRVIAAEPLRFATGTIGSKFNGQIHQILVELVLIKPGYDWRLWMLFSTITCPSQLVMLVSALPVAFSPRCYHMPSKNTTASFQFWRCHVYLLRNPY